VGDGEIYTIGVDGSGETNVKPVPSPRTTSTPDWGPPP